MSDQVVVFAPTRSGDEALVRTRWMAEHTIAMLRDENLAPVPLLDPLTRKSWWHGLET